MLKQLSILTVISLILLIFAQKVQVVLMFLGETHRYLNLNLSNVFSTSPVGNTTQEVLCLLMIPLLIAAIPNLIYWIIKRKSMPYFFHTLWAAWIVLFTSIALTH